MNSNELDIKRIKKKTFSLVVILICMFALLITSSYAWFSMSSSPRVSDMSVNIYAPEGLKLAKAYDAKEDDWLERIDVSDLINDDSVLKPVTYSKKDNCFKAIRYALDGRQSKNYKVLSDEENANTNGDNQYYSCVKFYVKTDSNCTVRLSDAQTLNDGKWAIGTYVIGSPIWNEETISHNDGGNGGELAVRIGFKISKLNNNGVLISEEGFYIYEPNADKHADKSEQVLVTKSIDDDEELIDSDYLILQSASSWSEANIASKEVTIKQLGSFLSNVDLFDLNTEEIAQIDMYLWIEGQDIDCYGLGDECKLLANIQFGVDYNGKGEIVETY